MAVLRYIGDQPVVRVTEAYRAAFAGPDSRVQFAAGAPGAWGVRPVDEAPSAAGVEARAHSGPLIEPGTIEPTLVWHKGGVTCAKVHCIATRHLRSAPSF